MLPPTTGVGRGMGLPREGMVRPGAMPEGMRAMPAGGIIGQAPGAGLGQPAAGRTGARRVNPVGGVIGEGEGTLGSRRAVGVGGMVSGRAPRWPLRQGAGRRSGPPQRGRRHALGSGQPVGDSGRRRPSGSACSGAAHRPGTGDRTQLRIARQDRCGRGGSRLLRPPRDPSGPRVCGQHSRNASGICVASKISQTQAITTGSGVIVAVIDTGTLSASGRADETCSSGIDETSVQDNGKDDRQTATEPRWRR